MKNYICTTCGVQFAESDRPPAACPICEDERQYVNWDGQQWTTMSELSKAHENTFTQEAPGLVSIHTEPDFAIAQRALLVKTAKGNVLWDCISLLDDRTIETIRSHGELTAIALSHPHYYSAIVEWSQAFDGIPVYLHAADRQWIMRPDPQIVLWQGNTLEIGDGLTLINCSGHFDGASVLHWAAGVGGKGVLLSGDTIKVAADRRYVSFMYSYPNLIPLSSASVRCIVKAVEPFSFKRLYGAWPGHVVFEDADRAVQRSAERYIKAVTRIIHK